MKTPEQITNSLIKEFDKLNDIREQSLKLSREIIKACSKSIRNIHRNNLDEAKQHLDEANKNYKEAVNQYTEGLKLEPNDWQASSIKCIFLSLQNSLILLVSDILPNR